VTRNFILPSAACERMLDWPLKKRWAIASGCFSLTLLPLLFPPGPLTVASDITVLLEPLDETGHVSYLRHFQQRFASIPQAENGYQVLAALPAARTFKERQFHPFLRPDVFYFAWSRQVPLGHPGFQWADPPDPESITWIDEFMAPYFDQMLGSSWSEHQPGVMATQTFHAQFEYAISEPWTRQQCPMVANYLDYNGTIFFHGLLEAAARPAYAASYQPLTENWYPSHSLKGENLIALMENDDFTEVIIHQLRYILRLQTMQMIGEKRTEEWVATLFQLHNFLRRWARQALNPANCHRTDISFYGAYAILIQYSADQPELRAQLHRSLKNLTPFPAGSEYIDTTLRLELLDFFQSCKQNGMRSYLQRATQLDHPIHFELVWQSHLRAAFTDWDENARYANAWIDTLVRGMKPGDTVQERERHILQTVRAWSGSTADRFLFQFMAVYLRSSVHHHIELITRDKHYLIELQLALEDYRAREGHYPASIDELRLRMNGAAIQVPHGSAELEYYGTPEGFILSAVSGDDWQTPPLDVHPHYFRSWNLVERSQRNLVCLGGDYRAIGRLRHQRRQVEIAAMEPGEYRDSMNEQMVEIEQQIAVLKNLRTVGGEIADYKLKGLIDYETKEYEPQHIWFWPENDAGDESVEIIRDVKESFPNIFLIDIRPTDITEAGLNQLIQALAQMDEESTQPVTILHTLNSERVITAFKELDSPLVALQISHTEVLLQSGEISSTGPSPRQDTVLERGY